MFPTNPLWSKSSSGVVAPEKSLWVQRFQNAEVGRIARVLSAVLKIKSTLFTNHKHMTTFRRYIYISFLVFFSLRINKEFNFKYTIKTAAHSL